MQEARRKEQESCLLLPASWILVDPEIDKIELLYIH